jgi:Xaa-Pro aminopeptidase
MKSVVLGNRLVKAQERMATLGIEAMFLSPGANLEYLTGERRRQPTFAKLLWTNGWVMGAWIPKTGAPFITAPRMAADYELQNEEDLEVLVLEDSGDSTEFLRGVVNRLGLSGKMLAIEDRAWSSFLIDLQAAEPSIRPVLASSVMSPLRAIKGPEELENLRKASEITDLAFERVVSQMRVGDCEIDVRDELEYQIRQMGSEPSMTTAVLGWGENFSREALDRDYLTREPFPPGIVVDFDFGAIYEGYCTDFGRVVYFGEPSKEFLAAYDAVVKAEKVAIAAMKGDSLTAEELHFLSLGVIQDTGFGKYHPDRTGHGIGMDIHEHPFLDKGFNDHLKNGMVFTVEPQIIKGPILARIEDLVVVTESGGEELTHFTNELQVIDV